MRQILSGQSLCPRCGLQNPLSAPFCASCGVALSQQAAMQVPRSTQSALPTKQSLSTVNTATPAIVGKIANFASRQRPSLTGVVIQVDAPQSMPPTFRLGPFLLKLGITLGIAALFGVIG